MQATVNMLTVEEVAARRAERPGVLILDVRNEDEWEEHHLSGAVLMPMHTLTSRIGELDKEKELIVVCEHGVRSLNVARFLVSKAGFQNVGNMIGGMAAWTGPVVTGE